MKSVAKSSQRAGRRCSRVDRRGGGGATGLISLVRGLPSGSGSAALSTDSLRLGVRSSWTGATWVAGVEIARGMSGGGGSILGGL